MVSVFAESPQTLLSDSPASVIQALAVACALATANKHSSPDVREATAVQRVMQGSDMVLDQRLLDGIAAVVLEQTRSLLPHLREQVESVVRQVV